MKPIDFGIWVLLGVALLAACQPNVTIPNTGANAMMLQDQGGELVPPAVLPQDGILDIALQRQIDFDARLSHAELEGKPRAIRTAALEALPQALAAVASLELAQRQFEGETVDLLTGALKELKSVLRLVAALETGDDQQVIAYHQELQVHSSAALNAIHLALNILGTEKGLTGAGRKLAAADLDEPSGYMSEVLVDNLNFPSAIAFGPDGSLYVAEAGFSSAGLETPARVLRIREDGLSQVVAEGFEAPLAGMAVFEDFLFVSHRGVITRIDLSTREWVNIITGLPSEGDFSNGNLAIGPDGKLYFTQGTATNTGVAGLDNYLSGWLRSAPEVHDIPCRDLTLNGSNFTSGDPLTRRVYDVVETGPYLPFGQAAMPGQLIQGQVKCNGAVLRADLDGSGLEVYADGFRHPYGLAFHPDGRLFVTENGPEQRGSRPVMGPDMFYAVVPGGWYGWPDYYGGAPVSDPTRAARGKPPAQPVLQDPPRLSAQPAAYLGVQTLSSGFDFARGEAFASPGSVFIAQMGSFSPVRTAGVEAHNGRMLVLISPDGSVQPFLIGPEFFRPVDAKFNPQGDILYVLHFGELQAVAGGVEAAPETGALISIRR